MAQTKYKGGGFIIEDRIIKGDEVSYDVKENNIGELVLNAFNETPYHIGQIDSVTEKKITFAEIKEKCIRLAVWLKKERIGPGDIICLSTLRYLDTEIIFWAISFVGATYAAFASSLDLINARHCIKTIQPRMVFAHKGIIDTLQEAAALENHSWKIILMDSENDNDYESLDNVLKTSSAEEIEIFKLTEVATENICAIFPTSGTTGLPKFIPLTHKQFITRVLHTDVGINGALSDRNNILLTYFLPGWMVQMLVSTRAIVIRQTLIFHKNFEPHETCKVIEKYKVTTLIWDVYSISLLAQSNLINKYNLESVTRVHSVGSKLHDEIRMKITKIFPNVYVVGRGLGLIETGVLTFFTEECCNRESEGMILENVQFKIIDTKTGESLEHNKNGELCSKSPTVMSGYYKNPTATKLSFDDNGWFHTGDEAYYDENGEVIVVGRLKEVIRYRGGELQPFCIEKLLLSHPNITDAAVIGIFHEVEIEQPVAFVQVVKGSNVTEQDILKLTCNLIHRDIFKGRIIFTNKISRNSNGKINRSILREYAENYYKDLS